MYKSGGGGYAKIVNDSLKELSEILVGEKLKNGTSYGRLRKRIDYLLEGHEATNDEIDQVYNHILVEVLRTDKISQ